ncbi:Hypothetical protein A7982_10080 [Minicystis rosea]|nr:Hypothetical protein A7982_10080 [Minicystis rosea]
MAPMGAAPMAAGGQRNVALIAGGAVLLLIALGAGFVFVRNLYDYVTIEDRWANMPRLSAAARDFGVRIIKSAAMNRMVVYGPVSALFGAGGAVLTFLGLRQKK